MTTILFAGGGTGGHLMPALALAEAIRAERTDVEPFFVGSARGVEARVLPARRWRYELLPLQPIHRREWWRNLGLPISALRSLAAVRRVVRREAPAVVIGTGGYVAGPVVWWAASFGIPAVILEQNAMPGYATRRLAGMVRQVHLGFPEARAHLEPGRDTQVFDSGNPISPPPNPKPVRSAAKSRLGFDAETLLVMVVGGSQGAAPLNSAVVAALDGGLWPSGVQLLWQTGASSHGTLSRRAVPGRTRVEAFLDPIGDAYAAADLIVCRAGAMTLAEIAAWEIPAVLIPLPSSAANHQMLNARAMAAAGAAVLLEQSKLTAGSLSDLVTSLVNEPARMADLATAAGRRARPEAAREIARKALGLLPEK